MFPKMIPVKGVPVPVDSWEELDELIQRYGADVSLIDTEKAESQSRSQGHRTHHLPTADRAILKKFVERESKGLLNKDLGAFLGVEGKSIRPALRKWAVKIKLAESEDVRVFEPFSRPDGRGYKLSAAFMHVARALLGEE